MLDAYKALIANQYEAALRMLARCIDRCPATGWNQPVASLQFSRGELHVCNFRHLQHHAAQLSLRLRSDAGVEIPSVGSGWRST
jgi:hypothetical protein